MVNKLVSIYGVTEYYLTEKGFGYYKPYSIDTILKNPHAISTEDSIKVVSDLIEINWPKVITKAQSHGDIQNHQKWFEKILKSELGI